ncbi:XTP/dITP diphosphohydrolase [Prosthecobacter debontii]|uniref:Nucleoside triphosphate pyrophosphohydrolase n=2 Tax=Prosthecobacter debontii TaxID=48467 RepID=A0A1T4YQI4_9BACT|nr:XTP/dITP diphosphohydrolase [Prosthecobacter debontii]
MSLDHPDPMTRLRYVVHRLRAPGGCPWDQEQTHETLIPHVIEEAYEVVDAIRSGDPTLICEELGDLLLQPILHAEIAAGDGTFNLDDMATGLTEKLIRRHPHVFGEAQAETSSAVLSQWDVIKRQEKGTQKEGHLHGVGNGLPALMKAQKLQKKAARVGFDWPDAAPVFAKIREEAAELEQAIAEGEKKAVEEELGDLLFSVVNLARKLGVESEAALAMANEKFVRRFHAVEATLTEQGKKLGEASLEEMDAAWEAGKRKV